jgi:hypothetical protein
MQPGSSFFVSDIFLFPSVFVVILFDGFGISAFLRFRTAPYLYLLSFLERKLPGPQAARKLLL